MKRKPTTRTDKAAAPPAIAPSPLRSAGALQNPPSPQRAEQPELPEGWQLGRLGEVADFERGISWGKAEESPDGVPVVAIPNIKEERVVFDIRYRIAKRISDSKRLRVGDILLVGSSGSVENVGRSAIVSDLPFPEATYASFLVKVTPTANLDRDFLSYLLASRAVDFAAVSKRAADGKYNLQVQGLKDLFVPLPPLAEQRAIAGVLRTVQAAREACERLLAATRQLKHSLLHHLFTYGPVPVHQADQVRLKETPAGVIPEHWQSLPLSELTEMKQGRILATAKLKPTGFPVFGANGQIGFFDSFTHANEEVLVTCRGSTCGTINVAPAKSYITNNAMVVTPLDDRLDKPFLAYALGLADMKQCITGTGQPQITKGKLGLVPLRVAPLSEQREIAAMLGAVDAQIAALEARRAALAALFTSLLEHLMTGRLRLPEFRKAKAPERQQAEGT